MRRAVGGDGELEFGLEIGVPVPAEVQAGEVRECERQQREHDEDNKRKPSISDAW